MPLPDEHTRMSDDIDTEEALKELLEIARESEYTPLEEL